MAANSSLRELAKQIAHLDKRVRAIGSGTQLAYSSIEDGALQGYNADGAKTMIIGKQWDGTYAPIVQNGPIPPTPTLAIIENGIASFTVQWDGGFVGAITPMDFLRVDAHVGTSADFVPSHDNRLFSFSAPTGGKQSINVDAGTYYIKLVCWTLAGSVSLSTEASIAVSNDVVVTSDGDAPAASPTPDALPGVEAIYLRWLAIANGDPVTYDIHISTTPAFTHGPLTKVGETQGSFYTLKGLPGSAPADPSDPDLRKLQFGATYYIQLVARDADGEAPPSAEIPAYVIQMPGSSIEANTITAVQVLAGSFTGEEFAGEVFIGSQFKTADAGQRLEWGVDGIAQFRSDESRRFYVPPTDSEDIYIDAQIVARGLQIKNGASFEGPENAIEKDAVIRLASGVSSPTTAVSASVYYDRIRPAATAQTGPLGTFALNATEVRSMSWNPANLFNVYQNRTNGTRVWRFNTDGSYNSHSDMVDWDVCNETWLPGDPDGWMLFRFIPSGAANQYYVVHNNVFNTFSRANGARIPWIGNNGSQIFTGEISPGALPRSAVLGFRSGGMAADGAAWPAATSTITTNTSRSWDGVNTQVIYGSFAGGSGGPRYAISEVGGTATLRMFNASGTWTDDDFDAPPSVKRGFLHDGTNFWTLGEDGWLYKHTNITWPAATSSTWWSQATLRDDNATGGTHETKPGPTTPVAFTMKRRATYRVTFPPVPYAGGVDDPNKWVLYTGRGASVPTNSAMFEQGTASNANLTLDVPSLVTTGTNPPTTNNFPGATPGEIRSDDLSMRIKGDGSGLFATLAAPSVRVGTTYAAGDNVAIEGPYWYGWISSQAAVASGTITTITGYTAEGSPNSSGITLATGIFTVPRAGRYLVRGQLYWAPTTPTAAAGTRLLQAVSVSPSLVIASHTLIPDTTRDTVNQINKEIRLAAGQQIFFRFRHLQGGTAPGANIGPSVGSLDLSFVNLRYIGA